MTSARHVAVIDIGKTNAKLALVSLPDLTEIAVVTRPNTVLAAPPYPHFDVEGHWEFLLKALAEFHGEHGVDAISVTTHGACAVLLDENGGLACPVLDYEHDGPAETAKTYDALRPGFAQTGSPRLGMGLNLGAQLHWLLSRDPALLERTAQVVTYPQYWGFRLTGEGATDVTSLGCHTDLWEPQAGRFSSLVAALGLTDKMAPARASAEVLGTVLPAIAERTGLSADTPVHVGIHDSNASLLPHVLGRDAPFSVVSTGTWVIAMAVGGAQVALDPSLDTLINVNALGDPVPSARFMGGREYDLAIAGAAAAPQPEDEAHVLRDGVMLLPGLAPETGPFPGRHAAWIGQEPEIGSGARSVAVGFYLALVTARCLRLIGHAGPAVVEGPFARNPSYLAMLEAVLGAPVHAAGGATGTGQGAALLVAGAEATLDTSHHAGLDDARAEALRAYGTRWEASVLEQVVPV